MYRSSDLLISRHEEEHLTVQESFYYHFWSYIKTNVFSLASENYEAKLHYSDAWCAT